MAEMAVFRRFQDLVRGPTGFLVSHRLGAARLALFRAQAHWYQ